MDAFEARLTSEVSSSLPRARRIQDEEWEVWRDRLTRLYVEEDVSRKDLVETMAREYHFIVNEKQLKHRFKKWNVRKYIPDSDTAAMLSFQRKRRAAGDQVTFECRGHKVEEERLERAAKRRKSSVPLDVVLPPYITVFTTLGPQHSKERPDTARAEPADLDMERISASQPSVTLGDPRTNAQVSIISAVLGNESEPTEATGEFEQIERSPAIEKSDVVDQGTWV